MIALSTTFSYRSRVAIQRILTIALTMGVFMSALQFSGCKKNETGEVKPETTLANLRTAYSREMRISHEYSLFAVRAEKDHYSAVAMLYKALSRAEAIHASMAGTLLRSKGEEVPTYTPDSIAVGTVTQTLHLALSDEGLETESMYPNLIHTAQVEKFPEAAESFRLALSADLRHAELIKNMLTKSSSGSGVSYYVCPGCGYIITSEKDIDCPGCHMTKDKFEKI
ncbi:MAG TPA: ferritin family protein [Bacteroidota bacterium]|nr:ferritin family protein [Bacteroidota bacterium]